MISNYTKALGRYTKYVRDRVKYINSGILIVSDNQYSFYKNLKEAMLTFANSNKDRRVYFSYILGKISCKKMASSYNMELRGAFRKVEKYNNEYIEFIKRQEKILGKLYPFRDNGTLNLLYKEN